MNLVISSIEDLLALHPGRNPSIQVVRYLKEIDNLPHDGGSVLGGVEYTWDERWLEPAEYPGVCLNGDGGLLAAFGACAELAAPFDVHDLDVADGGDKVRGLAVGDGELAPRADVVLGRGLLPIFDLGDFGAGPAGQHGKLPAGEPGIFSELPEPVAQGFLGLVNCC